MGRGGGEDTTGTASMRTANIEGGSENGSLGMTFDQVIAKFPDVDPNEPDWRVPTDFYVNEAKQFNRESIHDFLVQLPGVGESVAEAVTGQLDIDRLEQIDQDPEILRGLDVPGIPSETIDNLIRDWSSLREEYPVFEIDPAVAVRLLKLDYEGKFRLYKRWYQGSPVLIPPPERTCPGMTDAGEFLAQSIADGDRIAVFCDYDVDGTTAGEVLRRGLEPYGAKLHYGWADAQSGFGLTEDFVRQAAKEGCKTLVTLDCGSNQAEMVALAQELGMKVVVTDHHNVDPENPADYHLNPNLQDPPSSENTGAQLAWKLGAAVQIAEEGKTRPEHWETNLHLAGMGCMADMGSVVLPENRAFFWAAHEHPAPGVRALAEALEDDPETPGHWIATQACMNLPKRTAAVSAADVGALLAARDSQEAKPYVEKLTRAYEEAKDARKVMNEEAVKANGEAVWKDDGSIERPNPDKFIASHVFDQTEYIGYTGPVASKISRSTGKPAIIFARRGEDSQGRPIYKFSSRNDARVPHELGELMQDPSMLEACTIESVTEDGKKIVAPSLGGHAAVVSGACLEENIPQVLETMESWARSKGKDGSRFYSPPWNGPDAFLSERMVDPDRLGAIEEQAARLGPFTKQRQLAEPRRKGKKAKVASNSEIQISVRGQLSELHEDPDSPGWLAGKLQFADGGEREIRYPGDVEDRPIGEDVEWVLKVGGSGPYYLRKFARTRAK
jgi:single-stranded DNA-specific DHH superfamily exonuclease